MTLRLSESEYKRLLFKEKNTGSSPIHKSDQGADLQQAYETAVQAIRDIKGFMCDYLLPGDFELRTHTIGKTNADSDNIHKGIRDALEGIIYINDKQVKKGSYC